MKGLFTIFLLLLIAAGSYYPCCLKDDCEAENSLVKNTGAPEKKQGSCSPFSCAACTSLAEAVTGLPVAAPLLQHPVHIEKPILTALTTFSTPRWQPPRAS
ncbi:MAG TPA: hypothetical protein VHK91_15205 [Flavisolibacter sp.]|nr:hypothetical protein [Flavisolibacter sp.]